MCALGISLQSLIHAADASICNAACAVVYADRCEIVAYALSPKCVASREVLGRAVFAWSSSLLLGCAGALLPACSAAAGNCTSGSLKCASYMYCGTSQHYWCSLSQFNQRTPDAARPACAIFSYIHAGFSSELQLPAACSSHI